MLGALVLALAAVAIHGERLSTNVVPCNFFPGPLPLHVYVEGCVDPPCLVHPGEDIVMNFVFKAPRTTMTMRSVASAFFGPLPITPNPGPAGHTCNTLTNSYCPIVEGEILRSRSVVPLPANVPQLPILPVEFRVLGENDAPFVCLRLNVNIVQRARAGNITAGEHL